MFERLTAEPYLSKYSVEILSSPETGDPWVITMENVVSEVEAARLIELGGAEGYERSSDVGAMRPDGTFEHSFNDGRTSTNAWCTDDCWEDPVGQAVAKRLSNLTDIPDDHSENLQLLKYEVDQFYQVHHDYIPMHYTRQQGVRLLTAYLYLSDVEAGGGTNFDQLEITVTPKIGRVLLWPSVLDEDPDEKDERTTHQALPVEAGVKYGANGKISYTMLPLSFQTSRRSYPCLSNHVFFSLVAHARFQDPQWHGMLVEQRIGLYKTTE
jgi:prolyl 4-hydroxylase